MKAKLLLAQIDRNRDKWLELRRSTIGSSDIGTICGLNPYMSPLELWAEKTGKVDPRPENLAMWLGSQLELVVARLHTRETGEHVVQPFSMWAHAEHDWCTASPDAFIVNGAGGATKLLEIKTAGERAFEKWGGELPLSYLMQVQWQLGVCGMEAGTVGVLVGGREYQQFPVEFSPDLWAQAFGLAEQFLEALRTDTPPAAGPGDARLVEQLIGERAEESVALDSDTATLVDEYLKADEAYKAAAEAEKAAKAEREALRNRIALQMGAHRIGTFIDREGKPGKVKITRVHISERVQPAYSYERFSISRK